jgi:lysosomal acid phosphatase
MSCRARAFVREGFLLAGKAYRARYIDPQTCTGSGTCLAGVETEGANLYGVVNTPGVTFSNYNLYTRSSALDRTIMTALSFLDGVLPSLNNATAARFLPDGEQVRAGAGRQGQQTLAA